jgi:hypothetical protein
MDATSDYLEHVERALPALASTWDLIELGLFGSENAAYRARKRNDGPPYIRVNSRVIRYPKQGVLDFLRERHEDRNSG